MSGPEYDIDSAALKKYRRMSKDGLHQLTWEERRAYGEAVEKAVLAKQRSFLKSHTEPECKPLCASGTYHSEGEDIHKAMQAKHRAALAAAPARERRSRTPAQWQAMYDEAMQGKTVTP
jgi:hypothetical protein